MMNSKCVWLSCFGAVLFIGCASQSVRYPETLLGGQLRFLGQELADLEEAVDLVYDESTGKYYESSMICPVVRILGYEVSTWSGRVQGIYGEGELDYSKGDAGDTIRDIFTLLKEDFGSSFSIHEVGHSHYKRPMLLWTTDSCYVSLVYMPQELYEEMLTDGKEPAGGFTLSLKRKLEPWEKNLLVSEKWDVETLGLYD